VGAAVVHLRFCSCLPYFMPQNVPLLKHILDDPTDISMAFLPLIRCSSTTSSAQLTACHRDLARHFKTDPTETVALGVGYQNTQCLRVKIDTVSTD
jgi:hypothetical protein